MLSRNQRKERIPKNKDYSRKIKWVKRTKMAIGLEYLETFGKYNGRSSSGI